MKFFFTSPSSLPSNLMRSARAPKMLKAGDRTHKIEHAIEQPRGGLRPPMGGAATRLPPSSVLRSLRSLRVGLRPEGRRQAGSRQKSPDHPQNLPIRIPPKINIDVAKKFHLKITQQIEDLPKNKNDFFLSSTKTKKKKKISKKKIFFLMMKFFFEIFFY